MKYRNDGLMITGETQTEQRNAIVETFQAGTHNLLYMTTQLGCGLTLTSNFLKQFKQSTILGVQNSPILGSLHLDLQHGRRAAERRFR